MLYNAENRRRTILPTRISLSKASHATAAAQTDAPKKTLGAFLFQVHAPKAVSDHCSRRHWERLNSQLLMLQVPVCRIHISRVVQACGCCSCNTALPGMWWDANDMEAADVNISQTEVLKNKCHLVSILNAKRIDFFCVKIFYCRVFGNTSRKLYL